MAKRFKRAGSLGHHYIREWRLDRGLTQDELADKLCDPAIGDGITKATLSRVEKGELPYSQDLIEACAIALDVTPAELLGRDPTDEENPLDIWNRLEPEAKPQAMAILKTFPQRRPRRRN